LDETEDFDNINDSSRVGLVHGFDSRRSKNIHGNKYVENRKEDDSKKNSEESGRVNNR
jgi:hypothetical protein